VIYKRIKDDGTEYPHYWYRFKRNGVDFRVNTKQPNRRTAEDLEAAHKTRLAKGEAGLRDSRDVPTLKQFEPRFKAAIEARSSEKPSTVRFYGEKMASLIAFSPMGNARLDRIDEAMIERWVQYRRKHLVKQSRKDADAKLPRRQISVGTINRGLATLRRALRLAQEWKLIQRVPKFRLLPGEKNREFVLSKAREQAYLDACPQPLKDAALLILDTGLRLGEALRLEWRDVHLDAIGGSRTGYIQIRGGKTKNARRVLSLTARATKLLRERAETRIGSFVFSYGTGNPFSATYLPHLQQRVREKLNWSDEFVIHSLRHTMLTRLGEAGVDAFTIMRIAGHSSITVSQKYVHPTPESLERAFEKLDAFNEPERAEGGTRRAQTVSDLNGNVPHVVEPIAARALSTAVSAADS
jgi:integrase